VVAAAIAKKCMANTNTHAPGLTPLIIMIRDADAACRATPSMPMATVCDPNPPWISFFYSTLRIFVREKKELK